LGIQVEFYGLAQKRAGTDCAILETIDGEIRLGEALAILSAQFPGLASQCLQGNRLAAGYTANLDGQQFVADPQTRLRDGQSLLIMSADVGG